jgi:hypothetical protein
MNILKTLQFCIIVSHNSSIPEVLIFRKTAFRNIGKYQIIFQVCTVGKYSERMVYGSFSDKVQKKMPSKYVMKIYSKRHSVPGRISNWQALENGNLAAQ